VAKEDKPYVQKKTPLGMVLPKGLRAPKPTLREETSSDPPTKLLDSASGAPSPGPRVHVLFLKDASTSSNLLEQAMLKKGFHVTCVRHLEALEEEWQLGVHDLILLDGAVPQSDRLLLLRRSQTRNRPMPVMMVFKPDTEETDVRKALRKGALACVVRDARGNYLVRIPALIDSFAREHQLVATRELPGTRGDDPGTGASEDDLRALAEGSLGKIVDIKPAIITVQQGPDTGKSTQVDGVLCVIGRDSSCRLCLSDESISRFHASLKRFPNGAVLIKDLDSTNGTRIGNKPIKTARLLDGDEIHLGQDTVIRVSL
jgi:CheY-like chemotaxis protein